VLLMIEVHLVDSWTAPADRDSPLFGYALIVGGMGTALFLMLAGVAVALSAGSKLRRLGMPAAASNAVARRGLEIYALAFLFRVQAWILGWSSNPRDLLKVDILNVMGPSIIAAALIWRVAKTMNGRAAVFAIATLATAFVSPSIRPADLMGWPEPIRAYITPVAGLSNFVFFPWIGLVFAGAFVGVLIDEARSSEREKILNIWIAVAGVILVVISYASSFLPAERERFWSTSPSYFFIRLGLMMLGISIAYKWCRSPRRAARWSPIVQLGRTSLFIYWIHVEMVYGLISLPLHHNLRIELVAAAYVLFAIFMLGCSVAKDRVVARLRVVYSGRGAETIADGRRITS
jgi:uncharacterized membrane protein